MPFRLLMNLLWGMGLIVLNEALYIYIDIYLVWTGHQGELSLNKQMSCQIAVCLP